jgi:hypothetical protein
MRLDSHSPIVCLYEINAPTSHEYGGLSIRCFSQEFRAGRRALPSNEFSDEDLLHGLNYKPFARARPA